MKRELLLVLTLVLFTALLLCNFMTPVRAAEQPAGELRIALPTLYEETLHPYRCANMASLYMEQTYDYIIGSDDEGNLVPTRSIVNKWEVSADNLVWTFYIRPGVRFQNGDPLTPEDIKFSIQQVWAEKSLAPYREDYKLHIDSIQVEHPDKVVIRLKTPWPTMLYKMSDRTSSEGHVLPQKYYDKVGEDFLKHPIGTGPYKFMEQVVGSHMKFEAVDFPHWLVGVPKYKYITYKLVPEEGTRVAMLQRGEVDLIKVGINKALELRADGFPVHEKKGTKSVEIWVIGVNEKFPKNPMNKLEVRQALAYGINKQEIVDTIMKGLAEVKGTFYAMTQYGIAYPGRAEAQRRWPAFPYDPNKAKKLLAEAGYPNGFDLWFYSFESDLPEQKMITEAIASYWERIGVKVHILEMDYASFRPVWANRAAAAGLPAVFIFPIPARPVADIRIFHHTGMFSQIWDKKGEDLIEKDLEGQKTMEGYREALQRFFDHSYNQVYNIGLFDAPEIYVTNKNITRWDMGKKVFRINLQNLYWQKR
jgi:peptide/nickel transport system substrate-binding protein